MEFDKNKKELAGCKKQVGLKAVAVFDLFYCCNNVNNYNNYIELNLFICFTRFFKIVEKIPISLKIEL